MSTNMLPTYNLTQFANLLIGGGANFAPPPKKKKQQQQILIICELTFILCNGKHNFIFV